MSTLALQSAEFKQFQQNVVSNFQKYLTSQQVDQFKNIGKIEKQIKDNSRVNESFLQANFINEPSAGNDRYSMRRLYNGRKRVFTRPADSPKEPKFTPQMPLYIGTTGTRNHYEKTSIVDSFMHQRETNTIRDRQSQRAKEQVGYQDVVMDGIVNIPQSQLEQNLAPRDKKIVSTRRKERNEVISEEFSYTTENPYGVDVKQRVPRSNKNYRKIALSRPKMALDEKYRYANNTKPRGFLASSARVRDIEELKGDVRSAPNNRFKKLSSVGKIESTKRELNFDPTPRVVLSRERMARSHGGDLAVDAYVPSKRPLDPEILRQDPRGRSRFTNLRVDRKPLVVSTQKRMEVNVYDPPKISKHWTNSHRGGTGLHDNVTNYNRVEGATRITKVYKNPLRSNLVSIKEETGGVEAMQRTPIARVAGSLSGTATTVAGT